MHYENCDYNDTRTIPRISEGKDACASAVTGTAYSTMKLPRGDRDTKSFIAALRRTVNRYQDIIDNAREGIVEWAADGTTLFCNRAFAEMLGYNSIDDFSCRSEGDALQFCCPVDRDRITSMLAQNDTINGLGIKAIRSDGTSFRASVNARRVNPADGTPAYYEAFIENCTTCNRAEDKAGYPALHDPLTGMANPALLRDRLNRAVQRAARRPEYRFSVICLNLDRFKMINDNFGRNTGDDVLRHAAAAVKCCLRETDTVARIEGDDFVILIDNIRRSADTILVAQRIHKALRIPFKVADGFEISIGAGLGIVLHAERYTQPAGMLRDASSAMYSAKNAGTRDIRIFNRRMRDATVRRFALENEMGRSLEAGTFFLVYQPIVHMGDGTPYGFEALLRWTNNGNPVPPSMFIPVAEECGLINKLGLFVIEQACARAAAWSAVHKVCFAIHLNISSKQLAAPGFLNEVRRVLQDTAADPETLIFEITESVLMDDSVTCMQNICGIRNMGIKFCLDDFGTGWSSLNYLRTLPVSCIKADKSFVDAVEQGGKAVIVMRNLRKLGDDLNMPLIAEGVENAAQAEILKAAGCRLAQGFFYAEPLPDRQAETLLSGCRPPARLPHPDSTCAYRADCPFPA
ncbi:MAG: EAL domain-containing protein [Desulfovibrio sp.]|jgi:diguanylate cyclase (GGDEF)-like protein/PAS domain S-box-containing protein|nr:EAL domain-containing protein [Desulfovibrio sp.]